jgi:cytosine/adenosine deaminase-related metal-dependent hydrolase
MAVRTFRARWVLPIDAPPIAGGYVAIADGAIVAVGAGDPQLGPVADLGDVALMPGLVNAHTHLEFSGLTQPLGAAGMNLPAWIRIVIAERGRGAREPAAAIAAGLQESAAAGVTTIGEIATSPAASYPNGVVPRTLQFQEAIGFSAGRVDSVAAEITRRVDAAGEAAGISPHAPYTVNPQLLVRLVDLAVSRNYPIAMHLAESREELQLLRDGSGPFQELLAERSMWDAAAIPRGSRPLDYLRQLARAPRSLAIHGNYFDAEEIAYAAAHRQRMSVVYCPRTHAYFDHAPYPLEAFLAAGVRVALGTDSRASNPDLNLLTEIRFAAARFPKVDPARLVRMATLDAAEALGVGHVAGSLSVGKRAELATFRCDGELGDPYAALYANSDGLTALER